MKKPVRTLWHPSPLQRVDMGASCAQLLFAAILWTMPYIGTAAAALSDPTAVLSASRSGGEEAHADFRNITGVSASRSRRRRAITTREMDALLDYHNRVRSQVFPPAANMEYMVWDERLAQSADSWASRCIWDHGPERAMSYLGQNLSVNSGRYRSIIELVRSWHDEKNSFSYPNRCSGLVCTHYTQMVWASTNRMGCAVNRCSNMFVFGSTWREALLLVCNYSIKGNWLGEAPYKSGRPCSACPPGYGGSCSRNQCSTRSRPRNRKRF